jgi:hypothetical protein
MASSRSWPFDDDDRPSGSVRPLSQADLQAILAHLSDDSDELLAGTGADLPVVAVRVRATVGRPGGSAETRWRRMRAAEWAAWTRTLPWRVATTVGIGAGGGLLGHLLEPLLGLVLGGLAATAASWSGRGGWSCTTWPSPAARPTSIAMIPSAAVAVRSDPNIDRPRRLQSGSVDRCCGRRRAPTSRANVTS